MIVDRENDPMTQSPDDHTDAPTTKPERPKLAESPSTSWRRTLLIALLIVIATLIAYIPAMRAGYIWDDDQYLYENELVQSDDGLADIWSVRYSPEFGHLLPQTPQYYPFVFTAFWIEHQLWGLDPVGYHVVNIVLHLISALVLWRIAVVLRLPGAWFIAAMFALTPIHVESVAWVTERKNVLSGLFYLLALLTYLRYQDGPRSMAHQVAMYVLALLLFIAALLSKTVTCTLPVIILLIHFYREGWQPRKLVRLSVEMIPFFALGIAMGLMTAYFEATKVGAEGAEWAYTFGERFFIIAPTAYAFYALKVLWPHPVMFVYPRWDVVAGDPMSYISFAVLLGLFIAFVVFWKRGGKGPALLMLAAGATLFPALGFVNVYPHRFSWVADHFQYLGSVPFIIFFTGVAAWLGRRVLAEPRRPIVGYAVGAVVLAVCSVLTFAHARHYKDEETLWRATLDANPQAWIAAINLGTIYMDVPNGEREEDAIALFKQAAEHPWARATALNNQGRILARRGEFEASIPVFEQAVEADPHHGRALQSLASALLEVGRRDEAAEYFERAIEEMPLKHGMKRQLAAIRVEQGRLEDAADLFRRLIEVMPDEAGPRGDLAQALFRLQQFDECVATLEDALALDPTRVDLHRLLVRTQRMALRDYAGAIASCRTALEHVENDPFITNELAWMLATAPDDALRDGEEALRLIEPFARNRQANAQVLDTYAAALAETGRFQPAVQVIDVALQRARAGNNAPLVRQMQTRRALYLGQMPHRDPKPR
jgi:tetratricopeptide (TPR) repeat protein